MDKYQIRLIFSKLDSFHEFSFFLLIRHIRAYGNRALYFHIRCTVHYLVWWIGYATNHPLNISVLVGWFCENDAGIHGNIRNQPRIRCDRATNRVLQIHVSYIEAISKFSFSVNTYNLHTFSKYITEHTTPRKCFF